MGSKRQDCPYCGKPGAGYEHKRKCRLNPRNQLPAPEATPVPGADQDEAEAAQLVQEPPPPGFLEPDDDTGISDAAPGESETPPPPEDFIPEPPAEPPDEVEAKIEAALGSFRNEVVTELTGAVQNINEQLNNIPGLINSLVDQKLGLPMGQALKVSQEAEIPVTAPGQLPPSQAPGQGLPGGPVANLLNTIDWQQVAINIAKAKFGGAKVNGSGADFNEMVSNIAVKLLWPSSSKTQPDTKFFTRGANNAMSRIRVKGADPTAQALAAISESDNLLKEPITAELRGYYLGLKSTAQAFIQGDKIAETLTKAALQAQSVKLEGPPAEKPPPGPPA